LGALNLPLGGTVYLDTQAIVYGVERNAKYAALLAPLWSAQKSAAITIATSHLSLMECLVQPLRTKNANLIADFERTFQLPGLRTIAIDESVLRAAAQLRADHKPLRTPDAIHAATSFAVKAALFVSNDYGFKVIPGLPLALLDDVLAGP
jgi:predicted nucleic acid-binding protein